MCYFFFQFSESENPLWEGEKYPALSILEYYTCVGEIIVSLETLSSLRIIWGRHPAQYVLKDDSFWHKVPSL